MNFTYGNHLKYTIGGREFGFRENSVEPFNVSIGSIDKDHYRRSNFRKELLRTADLIYQDLGKDLVIFLSGGTDSEIVLRNFLDIGIKPRCATIKFKNDYNANDVSEAVSLAKEFDIDLDLIDFDVKDFLYSGEADEFGQKIQCTQLTYLMVYKCILDFGAPAIMGGEALLTRHLQTQPSYWYYTFRENEDASAMRFSNVFNIPLVNEYFSYTPELLLYYLKDPDIKSLVSTQFNYKLTSVSSKNAILKRLIPEIRVRKKTHGFERLLAFNFEAYRELSSEQIFRLEPSLDGIPYNNIMKQLRGK
jgi:hypothetical protein